MNILALETVAETCSVALQLGNDYRVLTHDIANQHSAVVLDNIHQLLAQAELGLSDIDLLAVDTGPGSFTGIRIGLGVTQGLAYAADLPVFGINSLAALACQAPQSSSTLAMIDARMGQVYWAQFMAHPLLLSSEEVFQVPLHLSQPEEVCMLLEQEESASNKMMCLGSGWDTYADVFSRQLSDVASFQACAPTAQHIAMLAQRVPKSLYLSPEELMPIYIRNDVATVSTKKQLPA